MIIVHKKWTKMTKVKKLKKNYKRWLKSTQKQSLNNKKLKKS